MVSFFLRMYISIEESLELLLPQVNSKFLVRRSRQLSEKAKENIRQEKEVEQKSNGMHEKKNRQSDIMNEDKYNARVKAVISVEGKRWKNV